ncbi:MAG: hypothetical protein LBC61_07710, partial [Candidatus Peribacteria bacterium]|nr:hypothetical protein [Candidatus Peribacteria bacterium]
FILKLFQKINNFKDLKNDNKKLAMKNTKSKNEFFMCTFFFITFKLFFNTFYYIIFAKISNLNKVYAKFLFRIL